MLNIKNNFKQDILWMRKALDLANFAKQNNEVPVGALLVDNLTNLVIGTGYNRSIVDNDPTAHAEILAIRDAGKNKNNYRLLDTTLYVTLEPCIMCVGAIIHARISRLVFGATDKRFGAVLSAFHILDEAEQGKLNHKVSYSYGILDDDCAALLTNFFRNKRNK